MEAGLPKARVLCVWPLELKCFYLRLLPRCYGVTPSTLSCCALGVVTNGRNIYVVKKTLHLEAGNEQGRCVNQGLVWGVASSLVT